MKITILIILFCLHLALYGQVFGPRVIQSWDNGIPLRMQIQARKLYFEVMGPDGRPHDLEVNLPPGRSAMGWGEVWQLREGPDGAGIYISRDGKSWRFAGSFGAISPRHFVPLSSDRILAMGGPDPWVKGKEASLMAVFHRNDRGHFDLERLVQPFSRSWYEKEQMSVGQKQEDPAHFRVQADYKLFSFHAQLCSTPFRPLPGGAVFLNLYTGTIWSFDGKGELRHRYQVFHKPSEADWSRLLLFEPALLGATPTADGTLLLASRTEDAVISGRRDFPVVMEKNGKLVIPEEGLERALDNQVLMGNLFNEIVWWELDPLKGVLRRMETTPPGAPLVLPPIERQAQAWIQEFTFTLDRNGRVHVIESEEKIGIAPK